MRIAVITQSYPPMVSGAAMFAGRLAHHIAASGHEVLVIAASERSDPYQEKLPNLEIRRLRSYRNPLRANQRFTLWPHRQIMNNLASFSPDLIHTHDPFQLGISGLVYGRSRNIPVVMTAHQLPWFVSAYLPFDERLRNLTESLLWGYAHWVMQQCKYTVAPSFTIAKVIHDHTGISPQVISQGVCLSIFSVGPNRRIKEVAMRARLQIPDDVPIILHVGRLDKDKQVDQVILAAALVLQKTQAHLLVIGDGTERSKLMRMCTQAGIGERCHFPGFIGVEDGLAGMYQLASVFVTASTIETQGLVLYEAAASGLPIVAVQASCLHEIVHEGQNGYLVDPGNIYGMADRINRLVQNPAQACQMGHQGRLIAEKCTEEKTFAAYEKLYLSAIQHPSAFSLRATGQDHAAHSGESY